MVWLFSNNSINYLLINYHVMEVLNAMNRNIQNRISHCEFCRESLGVTNYSMGVEGDAGLGNGGLVRSLNIYVGEFLWSWAIVNCGSPWGSSSWQSFGNRWNRGAGNFACFWTHQTAPGPLCQHGHCPLSRVDYRASIHRRAARMGREVWWYHGRGTWQGRGRGDRTVRVEVRVIGWVWGRLKISEMQERDLTVLSRGRMRTSR